MLRIRRVDCEFVAAIPVALLPSTSTLLAMSSDTIGCTVRKVFNGLLPNTPIVVDSFQRTSPVGLLYFLTHAHTGKHSFVLAGLLVGWLVY
jgi:hypothetical protein